MNTSERKLNTQGIARMPKHDDVVEEIVIASLIKFESIRDKVCQIEPDDFYNNNNRQYFANIKKLVDEGNADFDIKATNFKTELLLAYTHQPDVLLSKFDYYFKRLKQLSNYRKLENIAYQIEVECQEDKNDIDVRNKYIEKLNNIKPCDLKDIATVESIVSNEYEQVLNYNWKVQIPTGFQALDSTIGGFKRSRFYAIAGVPCAGKTTFMLNIMQNILEMGKNVLFGCMEMTYSEIVNKFISRLTEMSTTKLEGFNRCDSTKEEKDSINTAKGMVSSYKLYLIGRNTIQTSDIRDKIEYLGNIDILFIDYLQFIKASSGNSRYEQVTQISRDLKQIAIKYNIPVVSVISINRSHVHNIDKKPQLSDFRDSGNIEYDLDVALLLYRASQFDAAANREEAELNIGKNRHGKSNIQFKMKFMPEQSQFKNMEVSDGKD